MADYYSFYVFSGGYGEAQPGNRSVNGLKAILNCGNINRKIWKVFPKIRIINSLFSPNIS
jgi:hypothetical protein